MKVILCRESVDLQVWTPAAALLSSAGEGDHPKFECETSGILVLTHTSCNEHPTVLALKVTAEKRTAVTSTPTLKPNFGRHPGTCAIGLALVFNGEFMRDI